MLDNRKAILFVRGERPMLDDKYDLMRHPNIRLTEDGGAAPYDYTQAKDAADDLDYSPDQYDDFELLDPEDFFLANCQVKCKSKKERGESQSKDFLGRKLSLFKAVRIASSETSSKEERLGKYCLKRPFAYSIEGFSQGQPG